SPNAHKNNDFIHRLFLGPLPADVMSQVIGLAAIALVMKIVMEGLSWTRRISNRRIELNGTFRARYALYNKLQELGPAYQKTRLQGESIYRVSTDVEGFRIILNVLCDASFAWVTLITTGFFMVTQDYVLAAITMSVVPALLWANWHFAAKLKE